MRRLLTVARVAEAFHVLPSVAARALDEDPEQLDVLCLTVLSYASVKSQFDQAGTDDDALKHLKDHPHMLAVRRNAFDLHLERVAARRAAQEEANNGR